MAFPSTPLPMVTEMRINGVWTIVNDGRSVFRRRIASGLSITRGRQDWGARVVASRSGSVFENADGYFSNRLPTSPNYGLLGRNTPIRHRIRWLFDSFTRTQSDTWGSTEDPTPLPWTNTGGTSSTDYDVNGSAGTHTHTVANSLHSSYATPAMAVRDVVGTCSWSAVATGATYTSWVVLAADVNNLYAALLEWTTGGAVNMILYRRTAGVLTALTSSLPMGTYAAGTEWSTRLKVAPGGRIYAKAWTGTIADEPSTDWDHAAIDTAPLSLSTLTKVGLLSRREVGNTNTNPVASWSQVDGNSFRFWGEAPEFAPQWDASGKNVTVPVEAAGILQRLSGPVRPLNSPMFRTMSGVAPNDYLPHAYWSMEDAGDATQFASAVSGQPALAFGAGFTLADDATLEGSAPLPTLASTAVLPFAVPAYTNVGQCTIQVLIKIGAEPGGETTLAEFYASSGLIRRWRITVVPGSSATITIYAFDVNGSAVNSPLSQPLDGSGPNNPSEAAVFGHHCMLTFSPTQTGGNISSWFGLATGPPSGGAVGANVDAGTLGTITGGIIYGTAITSVGHLGIYTDGNFVTGFGADGANNIAAMHGYVDETAADRLERLCREHRIPFELIGAAADTAPMGPQQTAKLVDLLFTCPDVDQGILFEPRDAFGLAYRTSASLYNQSGPAVDYTSGKLGVPFLPVEDDQSLINDATVKRIGGSSARFVVEDGPLSTQDPPDGVGTYDVAPDVNLADDGQCLPLAQLLANRGTWDEARYPVARFDMAAPDLVADVALSAQLAALDLGDVFAVTDLPAWQPPGGAGLMVQGSSEFVGDGKDWALAFNCTPSGPYTVGVFDTARYDSDGVTTAEALDTTETGVDITVSDGAPVITGNTVSNPAEFPTGVTIGGEDMTCTASVSTGASTYTLTVTRSVNGVVKSHATGAPVHFTGAGRYAYT